MSIPENIPAVSVSIDIPDVFKPVSIDLDRIAQNLEQDFPHLNVSDWDQTAIYITSDHERGLSSRVSGAMIHTDVIKYLPMKRGSFFNKKIRHIANGREKVILAKVEHNAQPSPSLILAHEIKHAEEALTDRKYTRSLKRSLIAMHCGSLMAGIGLVSAIGETTRKPGELLIAVGGILAYSSMIQRKILIERYGDNLPYDRRPREVRANTYAQAAEEQWENVIMTGVNVPVEA